MSSPAIPVRRRRRPEYDPDSDDGSEDQESRHGSRQPISSKRRRAHGQNHSTSTSPEPVLPKSYRNHRPRPGELSTHEDVSMRNGNVDEDKYQPGAIVRVKVTNFVTYEETVFHPGPNLNMVIGPNGTGKSSLVCAICLGLGYGPSNLGRASKIGEFVKHGKDDATIEIELQGRPQQRNPVVKVRITREGDKRKWWLNNEEVPMKNVQIVVKDFGIQVDNLCQFLPQDRVAEFAGLSPINLLHETQRAAAPEEMLTWHNDLKRYRQEQKSLEDSQAVDLENLQNQQTRQEGLKADVERIREREQVEKKIQLLERTKPFVEYKEARLQWNVCKERKKLATNKLKDLERRVGPSLLEVNDKEAYHNKIEAVMKNRESSRKEAEREADEALSKIEAAEEKITGTEQTRRAKFEGDKKRKADLQKIQQKIKTLENQRDKPPQDFVPEDWNRRIRMQEHRIRDIETENRDLAAEERTLREQAVPKKNQIDQTHTQLASLASQAGQQNNRLRQLAPDTAEAWEWIQANPDLFDHEVYGPPLVSCSVKDLKYVDQLESLLQRGTFLAFTTQSRGDYIKLQKALYQDKGLGDIHINTASKPLAEARKHNTADIANHQLRDLGLDAWAIDLIDGPEPVLAMLCAAARIHSTGVALREATEKQFAMLVNTSISTFVTGRNLYNTTRRKEYGAAGVSTATKVVRAAQYWTDQPIDLGEKRLLQEKVEALTDEFNVLHAKVKPVRDQMAALRSEKTEVIAAVAKMKDEKAALQTAQSNYNAIPGRLERENDNLEAKMKMGLEFRREVQALTLQHDELVLEKTTLILHHTKLVSKLRTCNEESLEAEIRLLEAASDIEALKARNSGITDQLEEEKRQKEEAEREANIARAAASKALDMCKIILDEDDENRGYYNDISADQLTLTELEHDISAEKAKLDFMRGGNPGAIEEYVARQKAVAKLEEKIAENSKRSDRLKNKVNDLRAKWEPELDKLVQEISDAFAYNFQQINCAGEVGVHKDPEFENWSIEIKVKFRENETLQILDQHRQSGGERAVSTIFYLLALQSLARAPFRVVDEINQGMDPRNERMVHERMVEIACKEHTSQYFLITPKLLTNLRYHPRMKVLCIASGEYMPADYDLLSVKKAIEKRKALTAGG